MAGKKEETKVRRYIVIPRSNEALKERFAVANMKRIPFDTPVPLTELEVRVLKEQKEPIQIEGTVDVHAIMEEMQIPQEKANKIAEARSRNRDIGKKIKFVPKYSVVPA